MAAYTNINPSTQLVPGRPGTSALFQALEENPRAIAAGASGAPQVEVAWHLLQSIQLASVDDNVTFTVDISPYRAVRVVGGAIRSSADITIGVDLLIASTWRTGVVTTIATQSAILDITADRIDAADFKTVSGIIAEAATLSFASRAGTAYAGIINNTGVAEQIRVNASNNMTTDTEFHLYGIKRTAT